MASPSIDSAVGFHSGCALGHHHLATPSIIATLVSPACLSALFQPFACSSFASKASTFAYLVSSLTPSERGRTVTVMFC